MVLSPPSSVPPPSRYDVLTAAAGLVAESYPVEGGQATSTLATTEARGALVGLRKGDIVTNVVIYTSTGGTDVTAFKLGLYTVAGDRLGRTADIKAGIVGGGFTVGALATPVTIGADGGYYLVVWSTATTACPAYLRSVALGNLFDEFGSGARRAVVTLAVTDLDPTLTFFETTIIPYMACT